MGDVGIGIDFGTSFSCVAVCRDGKVEVIANEHDKRLTPSYVAFTEEERLYGDAARHQNPLNLKNTFYQTKMLLGRKYEEIPKGAFIGYDIEASDSKLKLPFIYKEKNKPLSPEQVSAMVIGKMKKDAEIYLDTKVKRAVISVPASFNHAQRKATIDAGKIAGFETVELINGTTAAAIAYGLDREKDQERNVLILDFGGGKFDVSIVKIHKRNFQVMGAYGDSCFGGKDFDNNLVRHFTGDESNFNDKKAICRLQEACEKAKRTLSGASRARIRVDCLFGGKPFGSEITRSDFEDINKEYFDRALEIVKKVFRCANMKESEITELVLVGGSTRIPKFRHLIQEYFNGMELSRTINPDEAVACGAALHCASKKMNGYTMVDVASRPIVIKDDRNTQEYTLVKPLTNLPSTTKLTAPPGSQWQVFEGEPVVDSSTDSIFTVQADSMTRTEFVWVVEMNGLVNVETSVNGETTKPNIVSRNTRNVSKDDIQKMMEQHAEFQMDDDLIAKASDDRNALEKDVYNIKQSITSAVYEDKLENNVKEEITSECNRILEWLDKNQNASVDECSTKRNELDRICLPLLEMKREEQKKKEEEYKLRQKARNDLKFFINDAENKAKLERFKFAPEQPIILRDCQNLTKLMVDNQNATINEINDNLQKFRKWIETMFEKMEQSVKTMNLKQQKIEDEKRELCKEAQNELKNFIEDAESRVKLQDYEFARDKPEILQNCQNLRKWMEDNQNATINDINDKSQKFRKWIDDTFEKMEQVVKAATKKELQLISESKQKLEECLIEINKALSDPKIEEYLVDTEKEIINKYCAEANALLNKSNPSKKELNKRRKAIEKNCYPIFSRVDNKIQTTENERKEMQLQNDLSSLEIFSKKVLDVTSELVLTNKISSNKETRISATCNKILELIRNGEIKTTGSCETYHENINEIYQPLKKLEKHQNMEANKIDYDSGKEELRKVAQPMFDMLDQEKEESAQHRTVRQAFENYVLEIHDYLKNTPEVRLLPEKRQAYLDLCLGELNWIRNNQNSDFETRLNKFKGVIDQSFNNMKQEDKNAKKNLLHYVEEVTSMIERTKSDDFVDKVRLQSYCSDIKAWIFKNPESYSTCYEHRQNELKDIKKQYLQQKNKVLQSDFVDYMRQIKYHLENMPYVELLNPDDKNTLLQEYNDGSRWIEKHKDGINSDLVEKKKDLARVCQPIIDKLHQTELNRTKKALEDYVHQVERKVRYEYSSRLNENEKKLIEEKCKYVRQYRNANKNATTEEIKTVNFDFTSVVEPILEKLRDVDEQVITQQPRKEQSTPEYENRQYSEEYRKHDVRGKNRLISSDQTKYEQERGHGLLRVTGYGYFPSSDIHKREAHTQILGDKKGNKKSTSFCFGMSQKTSPEEEYRPYSSTSGTQSQSGFSTLDEKIRPNLSRLRSSSARTEKHTPITDARAELLSYAEKIKRELENANKGTSLSVPRRQRLYGECTRVINSLGAKKKLSLNDIKTKRKQLQDTYEICGLGKGGWAI